MGVAFFSTLLGGHKPLGREDVVFRIRAQVQTGAVLANARLGLSEPRKFLGHAGARGPVDAATREFVLSMLSVDPAARPSALQLLACPFFDGIREEARRLFGDER